MDAWSSPPYDLSKSPSVQCTGHIDPDSQFCANFPRVGKWSPDGSVILAQCENRTFQMFDGTSETKRNENKHPISVFHQAAPILDFIWYPTATPHEPSSFCFIASVRECPVKLLDASDGRLRASYRVVDHRERQIAPHSFAFNLTGQKLYCGFEDAIKMFDVSRPGEGTRIPITPSKKSKDGLKGIISSLAFSPSYSPDESFYAAGSFTPIGSNIAMLSDAQEEPIMYLSGSPRAGVTQLQFNPVKPHILYAAYRGQGTGKVCVWDIRSNVDSPLEIFQTPNNGVDSKTNQKMRFDVDIAGRMLSIGDQFGNISVFEFDAEDDPSLFDTNSGAPIRKPTLHFKAHEDAVGSVAFHPLQSRLLSASGSRHFTDTYGDEDMDGDSLDDELECRSNYSSSSDERIVKRLKPSEPVTFDSVLKIWDFGEHSK